MALAFCSSCGSKYEYKFAKPNFCSKCGCSFNDFSTAKTNPVKKNLPVINRKNQNDDIDESDEIDEDYNDDEVSNATFVPRISNFQVDVESSSDVRILKFNDLLNINETKFTKPKNLDF